MFLASAAFLALALFPVAVPPLVPLLPLSQLHALYPSGRRLLWETWSSGVRGMLGPFGWPRPSLSSLQRVPSSPTVAARPPTGPGGHKEPTEVFIAGPPLSAMTPAPRVPPLFSPPPTCWDWRQKE